MFLCFRKAMKHQTTQSTWRSFNLDFLTEDLHTSGQTDFNHPSLKNTRTREKATRCRTGHVDLLSLGLMLATVSSPSEHKTWGSWNRPRAFMAEWCPPFGVVGSGSFSTVNHFCKEERVACSGCLTTMTKATWYCQCCANYPFRRESQKKRSKDESSNPRTEAVNECGITHGRKWPHWKITIL